MLKQNYKQWQGAAPMDCWSGQATTRSCFLVATTRLCFLVATLHLNGLSAAYIARLNRNTSERYEPEQQKLRLTGQGNDGTYKRSDTGIC
jgi:hypothetical protein